MSNNAELLALAERCEAATEPDRELDRDIAIAIFDGVSLRTPEAYTGSLDAAMALIPKSWHLFSLGETRFMLCGPWLAQLSDWQEIQARYHGAAATPALALCAVTLRTLASTQTPSGAAPELYEALMPLVGLLEDYHRVCGDTEPKELAFLEDARAALAKARGV